MNSNKIPNNAKKPFKVPDNYFQELDAEIFAKINFEKSAPVSKNSGFVVPDNYFENLDAQIISAAKSQKSTKVISLFNWKNVAMISGIAATLALMISLVFVKGKPLDFDDLETASIERYISEEDINTYEMAQFLELNFLELYEVTGSDLSESALEDYLLENATLNDLYQD